jgi:hypothetical protein
MWRAKRQNAARVKYWEIIGDNLKKAGWSWGCISTINSNGQTIFVADAHRDHGCDRSRLEFGRSGSLMIHAAQNTVGAVQTSAV